MEPSGLLLFGVLFVGVLLVLALFWLISRTKAFLRGEPFLTAQRFQQAGRSVRDYRPVMQPAPLPVLIMSREKPQTAADQQTDRADRPSVSADSLEVPRLQLDKTKTAIIELLVYNGWQAGEIRSVLKGDNGVIGTEVEAARKRLGIDLPERTLKVRDEKGERVISMTAAPSARANYHHGDPDLEYQNPPI